MADIRLLHSQLTDEQRANIASQAERPHLAGGNGGPHLPGMDERIGRLEGSVEGLRHSQNLTVGIVSLVALVLIGLSVYELQRLDSLSDKVSALPGQISSDMRDLTKTLADAITAAKQQPPQVILMPAPPPQPAQPQQKQ